jgi:hypothetical protein
MLHVRTRQTRWPEASSAKVEQTLMMGFYAIRKLIEAKKICDALVSRQIHVKEFAPTGKMATLLNWHHIDRFYKLESSKKTQIDLMAICHQFVHSYIFILSFDDNRRLDGVFLTSDKKRSSCLYYVEIKSIIDLFEKVGRDYPTEAHFIWDKKKQDYRVTNN